MRPLALIRDREAIDEVLSRWEEADVRYRPLTRDRAQQVIPTACFDNAAAIFEVEDVSINTRILYRKLLSQARKSGCVFFLGHELEAVDGSLATLKNIDGGRVRIESRKFVYSAGIGTKALFHRHHGQDLPIRYWKSHLVVTKRLAAAGIFFLDAQEAAMMHHGDVSIIGFNEDALLSDEPSYDVIPDRAANLRNGIRRVFPNWNGIGLDIACVKVDFVADLSAARSLNIAISEPLPGHVLVLPGKMTEAPFLTDALTSYLHQHLDNPAIALRPCDEFFAHAAIKEVA